jgi:hypothetical protein
MNFYHKTNKNIGNDRAWQGKNVHDSVQQYSALEALSLTGRTSRRE